MLDYKNFGRIMHNVNHYNHLIIAIDFDGTLCLNNFPHIGKKNKTLIEQLKYIKYNSKVPTYFILWTCRVDTEEGDYFTQAKEWCKDNQVPIDYYNESPFEATYHKGGIHSRKLYADFYIDDHNVESLDLVIGSLMRHNQMQGDKYDK